MDPRYITEEKRLAGKIEYNRKVLEAGGYMLDVEWVRRNFSEWKNIEIIQGTVPETLGRIEIPSVAYLHLDMNCALPERAAAEHFWPRLVPGALMLLDDYAYSGYEPQKRAMDEFAHRVGITIVSLPTGQGLAMKPPD